MTDTQLKVLQLTAELALMSDDYSKFLAKRTELRQALALMMGEAAATSKELDLKCTP